VEDKIEMSPLETRSSETIPTNTQSALQDSPSVTDWHRVVAFGNAIVTRSSQSGVVAVER
jgi:hypothetical protein